MRRIQLILISAFFLLACSEPNRIIYEFNMVNDSEDMYLVKRHYRYTNIDSKTDTLFSGEQLVSAIPRVGKIDQAFGDTLIRSFFDTLLVKRIEPVQIVNVYARKSWVQSLDVDDDFLKKPGSIKGKVVYTLMMGTVVRKAEQ